MKSNNIIFADLSTYTPNETISFYESVFDWQYHEGNGYYLAFNGNDEVVGLYETPEKFKKMRMPHFWMTYIHVESLKETVTCARELGGIIEMEQSQQGFGNVALIRDPQGAGFTIYEGDELKSTRTNNGANTLIWNELHVSNAQNIIPFYKGIFDWNFQQKSDGFYEIYNRENKRISDAVEIPNEKKGKFEYWVCVFGVSDLQKTTSKILLKSGSIITDEGTRILCADNSGEAFFYVQEIRNQDALS